jgi:hypothetical protein
MQIPLQEDNPSALSYKDLRDLRDPLAGCTVQRARHNGGLQQALPDSAAPSLHLLHKALFKRRLVAFGAF